MDKIEKIRQEIERRIEAIAKAPSDNGVMDSINGARGHELMRLLSFLDTLSEEPNTPEFPETFEICLYDGRIPNNEKCTECSTTCSVRKEEPDKSLEEAAIDFADNARKQLFTKDYAISSIADYDHGCIDGFKAGAEWQKSQMLKDAVEGYVNYYEDSGGILMAEAQVGCPYHNGDKVRIVVLKEEE